MTCLDLRSGRLSPVLLLALFAVTMVAPLSRTYAAATPTPAVPTNVENAVVKVFSTLRYPDPFKPWTKQAPSEVTASGVVIEGKRILTNAHVVLYSSQVQIQAKPKPPRLTL
jgi:S1-C subfamily serine protease